MNIKSIYDNIECELFKLIHNSGYNVKDISRILDSTPRPSFTVFKHSYNVHCYVELRENGISIRKSYIGTSSHIGKYGQIFFNFNDPKCFDLFISYVKLELGP